MTAANTDRERAGRVKTPKARKHFRFPDPPEIPEDKMTSFDQLTPNGTAHYLSIHLGNPETTLIAGEHYLAVAPTTDMTGVRYPDLLVAFGVDPAAYKRSNAYVISEQGKPPDFVLEIVSRSSRRTDRVDKREDYAALGIPNTGGLTRRAAAARTGWRATGWRMAATNPSPSRSCRTACCKGTARS